MPETIESAEAAPPPSYRPCVGIALISRSGAVFVGRRRPGDGAPERAFAHAWQMPQGGIDPGEDPGAAAIRELYEETSVPEASLRPLGRTPGWLAYDLPAEAIRPAWRGRYRGQAQKWFAFGFLGRDDEIDVLEPGQGRHRAEFDAWRWASFAELPALVVPFKRPVYEAVFAAFAGLSAWSGRP